MTTRILVVDDEDGLRQLLQKYLIRSGYEVEAAANIEQAWKIFDADPDTFDLALVDLTLPDGSGEDLMFRMLERAASVRVLLSSGYTYDVEKLPPAIRERVRFLQKPYLPRQLMEHLKPALPAES